MLEYKNIKQDNQDFFTVFIYDWDDTFLCTNYLVRNEHNLDKHSDKLIEIADSVINILSRSLESGRV